MPPFLSVSPAGSVFMCRLCNVFSPSRSQLLAHCSQLHPQQEPLDDIIIALQPLVADPVEKLAGQSTTTSPLLLSQKKTLLRSVNVLTFGYTDNDCRIMSLLMLFSQVDVLQELKKQNKTVLPFFLTVLLDYWPTETPVKRKRGRPKGSTKKMRTDLTEGTAISSHSPENNSREEKRKKEEIQEFSSAEGCCLIKSIFCYLVVLVCRLLTDYIIWIAGSCFVFLISNVALLLLICGTYVFVIMFFQHKKMMGYQAWNVDTAIAHSATGVKSLNTSA